MPRGGMEYQHKKNLFEVMNDIKEKAEPWKTSALWKTKDACFYKARRDGTIRMYRTGGRNGFCWADLKLVPIRGGGTIMIVNTAATMGTKLLAWALCVVCLFMVAHDWVEYGGGSFLARDLPYLLVCALAVVLTLMTGRETPKLLQFLEQDLGWERAR
ncbi:MAG: hypothetical protein VB071_01130 [Lawsonibacter sp.]|nr:hypothetical protein [Lawsonibacter sp.]